jgi:hypothetical protein
MYAGWHVFSIDSRSGRIHWASRYLEANVDRDRFSDYWPWMAVHSPASAVPDAEAPRRDVGNALGFGVGSFSWKYSAVTLPYWFLALSSGGLALGLQLRWPWRFTLRTVFIATTFLAAVLGMIAWLEWSRIGE